MQTKIFKIQNSQPTHQSSLFGSFLPNRDSLVISLYFLLVWNQPWPPTLLLRRPRRRTSRPSWNLGMDRFFIWNTESLSWPELAITFSPKHRKCILNLWKPVCADALRGFLDWKRINMEWNVGTMLFIVNVFVVVMVVVSFVVVVFIVVSVVRNLWTPADGCT